VNPLLIDGIVALVVFGLMAGQFIGTRHLLPGQHPTTPQDWLLAALIAAPILTHRRFPLTSLAVCLAAVIAFSAGRPVAYPGLAVFALTFAITLHSSRRVALTALLASAAAMTVSLGLQTAKVASAGTWIETELGVAVAWLSAENIRNRRARWAELHARAERLEREHQEEARRAVTQERLRIARELHDVIAHSMSVIAVQSAVGNHVIDTQPQEARHALAAIEATSRSALTEMRRLLGVLRQEGEPVGSLVPAPGLADLSALIAQVEDAGLQVRIRVDGQRGTVPPGVDLSAYRVIQEALTNVIKHAASAPATVTICYREGSVTVEITDEGPATSAIPAYPASQAAPAAPAAPAASDPPARRGCGIIGMRERVAVFGGEFAAGPRPEGGFGVRARFPIPEVTG
jgi:signal transduction histidine kinase